MVCSLLLSLVVVVVVVVVIVVVVVSSPGSGSPTSCTCLAATTAPSASTIWTSTHRERLTDPFGDHPLRLGTIQRRLAWRLRKDDTHKSRSINNTLRETSGKRDIARLYWLPEKEDNKSMKTKYGNNKNIIKRTTIKMSNGNKTTRWKSTWPKWRVRNRAGY